MALPTKHILHQGPVMASLGETAIMAALQRLKKGPRNAPEVPGPEISVTLPPRSSDLVRDYIRHVGGDPSAYRGTVPAHMFPQWGFPLAARTLRDVPYPLMKVLNGGCRLEARAPLPADEPLEVRARLESIDDNGRRAVLCQRISTSTASAPGALVGYLYAVVPLGGKREGNGQKTGQSHTMTGNGRKADESPSQGERPRARESSRVPENAREIAYWKLGADAGLAFAMLTGDFNPVHWIRPYARAFGFRSTILHGFSTMARAMEGLNRGLFAGDTSRITTLDVQFTRPLVLPARVGLYVHEQRVFVGDAPGGPAYLVGTFEAR